MLFSSLTFLFGFLPLVLALYFLIKDIRYRNIILLIFSLIFYAWGEPVYLFLMLFVILLTYLFGLLLNKYHKKGVFVLSLVCILSFLVFFKYTDFLIDIINSLFKSNITKLNLALPIGISFFTFQAISYLIDLYRGKVEVQKSFFNLALYVCLFPQLIAGPIVRYDDICASLETRTTTVDDFIYGTKRFIVGLSKKILISNQMALIADTIVGNCSEISGSLIFWIGAIAYTFQLYFDFSGYSDMAIGLGRIFGFHFLENFNYPYISKTVTEFWRRWHISLSSWFRDYIYIPLGGNRVSKSRHVFNILCVWLLTGLWHGASYNYILWGIYYGILLLIDKKIKLPKGINHIVTLFIVVVGWTIFKIEDLNTLLYYLKNMFSFTSSDLVDLFYINSNIFYYFLYFIPAIIFSCPIYRAIRNKGKNNSWYLMVENIVLLGMFLMCVMFLLSSNYNPFIYFRF